MINKYVNNSFIYPPPISMMIGIDFLHKRIILNNNEIILCVLTLNN